MPKTIPSELPAGPPAIDRAARAIGDGGWLIYLGAGASGRMGVPDASECPLTFGMPPDKVISLIAGGPGGLLKRWRGAENNMALGECNLRHLQLTPRRCRRGARAVGPKPCTCTGCIVLCRSLCCATAVASCNPDLPIAHAADIIISSVVGPEVLTGSTCMKFGTTQKLVLNMISTGAVVKLGRFIKI